MNATALHPRECFICGCSDDAPCPGGCSWVDKDLCSRCAGDFTHDSPACVYCGAADCTRMGGLLLCRQAETLTDGEAERYDCPVHGPQDGPDCARC